ncbi:uncharacterized protein LOC112351196 [Selaginella moellendorffii]|uniref:uncharacterized protein LOC112351196 n=1 Tax=Selaginella moellendorffii TaxID=88036 RepID=UPI000D1CD64D|nr:uncharacterized protein LOC112351196 [Selaginella moellendorffii]|eukprot:XP_024544367.1 uncharacterized protein LOC112351196 [Selaginella moellendorffii]
MILGLYFVKPGAFYKLDFLPDHTTTSSIPTSSSSSSSSSSSFPSKVLLQRLSENGTRECHNVSTAAAILFGLPRAENEGEVTLSTGVLHKLWIVSYAGDGSRRCFGGDFFETDLSGPNWKSRPPVTDVGDGSYLVELKVDDEFAGPYTFKAILLFPNFHGLDQQPDKWALKKEMFLLKIRFASRSSIFKSRPLPICSSSDFRSNTRWSGKWTRTKFNESCKLDKEGRYRCLDGNEKCDESQCSGAIASLESNGWVYSAHCKFQIWSSSEAWKCLDGKKIFFWGDSNHQDTIRNLMNFVLGFHHNSMPRTFIANLTNPSHPSQNFTVVEIFNGHTNPNLNFLGLATLDEPLYRAYVTQEFLRGSPPDALILNSGMHDGVRCSNASQFLESATAAAQFWKTLATGDKIKSRTPRVIFRSTITPAGESRSMPSNPQKMEAFNQVLGDEIRRVLGKEVLLVDAYDMTFPWHYDHRYSDGGHYGRPPSLTPWYGGIGHYYFADLMLVHALLTAICS